MGQLEAEERQKTLSGEARREAQLEAARQAQQQQIAARAQAAAVLRAQRIAARAQATIARVAARANPAPPPSPPPSSSSFGRNVAMGLEMQTNANAKPSQEAINEAAKLAEQTNPQPQTTGPQYIPLREGNLNAPTTEIEVTVGNVSRTFPNQQAADQYIESIKQGQAHQELGSLETVNSAEVFQDGNSLISGASPIRHSVERKTSPESLTEFRKPESTKPQGIFSELKSDLSTGVNEFKGDIETGLNDLKSIIGTTSSSKVVTNTPQVPSPTGAINPDGAIIRTNPKKTYYIVTVTTQTPSGKNEIKNFYFTDPAKAQAYQTALQNYSSQN